MTPEELHKMCRAAAWNGLTASAVMLVCLHGFQLSDINDEVHPEDQAVSEGLGFWKTLRSRLWTAGTDADVIILKSF